MRLFTFMKYSLLLLLLTLSGCITPPAVTSWLDPVSVATITSQTNPLVMARFTPTSKSKRSMAQLSAIEINRMGARRLYLVLIPSIVGDLSPQELASFERSFDKVEIFADDQALPLTRYTGSVTDLGIGEPALLPVTGSPHIYYSIERAELRSMVGSKRLELVALGVPGPGIYGEWRDGRRSLGDFLGQLPRDASDSQPTDAP